MPYDVHVSASKGDTSLIITASLADQETVQSSEEVLAPILKCADLGARGGLSSARFNPREAKVTVVAADILPDRRARWHLSAERIAPEAMDMLLGSIGFIDVAVARLKSVAIEAPPVLTGDRQASTGGYFRPTPFTFVDDRSFQSKGFQIEIRFAGAQPQAVLDETEIAFGSWFSAANVGCFSSKSVPANMSHAYLGDPERGDDVLVLSLDEAFVSEPEATQSLVNVLHWSHWHVAPIVHVELYE